MPLLGVGRANLQAGEEDLIAVLPHDEGTDSADQGLDQIQHDLEQEVERESPGDDLTVLDPLIGEGASYGVVGVQGAHTVISLLVAREAAGLRVVVPGERRDQHRYDQANRAQDKVQELQREREKNKNVRPCTFTLIRKTFSLLFYTQLLLSYYNLPLAL